MSASRKSQRRNVATSKMALTTTTQEPFTGFAKAEVVKWTLIVQSAGSQVK